MPETATQTAAAPAVNTRQLAFDQTADLRRTVDPARLQPVTMDVEEGANRAKEKWRGLETLLPALRTLADLDIVRVERIPVLLEAVLFAREQWVAVTPDPARVRVLVAQADPLRKLLLRQWTPVLVKWGVFTQEQLDAWEAGSGHLDMGMDLVAVGEAWLARWADVAGRVPMLKPQVEQATELGRSLLAALGAKVENRALAAARDQYQRAFSLLVDAWDELRRGVVYLRWHDGDADELAPSLFALRPAARAKKVETAPEPAPA